MVNEVSQRLDLKQAQTLVMTPQLQQAIKLLQMNNIELNGFIEEELEKNPLLDREERPPSETEPLGDRLSGSGLKDFSASVPENDPHSIALQTAHAEKNLREHLLDQLHLSVKTQEERLIGALLIDQLDEGGYLRSSASDLAKQLETSAEKIGALLDIVKQFEPAGLFARDLQECLKLQLIERDAYDRPMQVLLEHLDLMAEGDHAALAKLCGVNRTYLDDMIAEIRSLDPKPGAGFGTGTAAAIQPDIFMKKRDKSKGGGWDVILNNETLPRLLVNETYAKTVAADAVRKEDKQFVREKTMAANWLVRAVDQRAQTILKTAAAIIETQEAFFQYGIEFLRPMTLKDIADEIGMHESTVSRVTTNKYMATPRGLFELKYFFTTGLKSESGISHSAETIKNRIKALVDAETAKTVLSDDKLVQKLKEDGFDVARRTVAKYREQMHIPSSVLRRRQKKNAGL